jgi:hypothetical protein
MTIEFRSTKPVSVQAVLDKLANDYKLNFVAEKNMLFIARGSDVAIAERTGPEGASATLPIADLVSNDEQVSALITALGELLPELAGGLQFSDGAIYHADLDNVKKIQWFQAAQLLQTWRVKRGIENALTSKLVPASQLLGDWPVAAAQQNSQKKIQQTLLPEPLANSLHRMCKEAGMTCWVDWPGLANAQIPPGKVVMSISRGRSLNDLLQNFANKFQMVFALENENSLWATAPDMHRFQARLYLLPIAGKSVEQWSTELTPLTPYNADGTPSLKIIPTPDGQFIFVRCCRPWLIEPQP